MPSFFLYPLILSAAYFGPCTTGPVIIGMQLTPLGKAEGRIAFPWDASASTGAGVDRYTVFWRPLTCLNVTDDGAIEASDHPSMRRPFVNGKERPLPTDTSTVTCSPTP